MRTPKNRLQELAQNLQQRQTHKSASIQGEQQGSSQPLVNAQSFDQNQPITLQSSGQQNSSPAGQKATIEAMAFDYNEPIELRYNQETGSYEHPAPTFAAAQSVGPGLNFGSEAFEVESFDAEPATVAEPPVPVRPEVVADSKPMAVKSAAPSVQSFGVEAAVEPKPAATPEVATADDFLEDLNAILNGEKTYDGSNKQVVNTPPQSNQISIANPLAAGHESATTPADSPQQASPHEIFDRIAQGLPPTSTPVAEPTYSNAHSIFDRMGKNMAYANSFDLGTISLQQRFDEFDAILDEQESEAFAYKDEDESQVPESKKQLTQAFSGEAKEDSEPFELGKIVRVMTLPSVRKKPDDERHGAQRGGFLGVFLAEQIFGDEDARTDSIPGIGQDWGGIHQGLTFDPRSGLYKPLPSLIINRNPVETRVRHVTLDTETQHLRGRIYYPGTSAPPSDTELPGIVVLILSGSGGSSEQYTPHIAATYCKAGAAAAISINYRGFGGSEAQTPGSAHAKPSEDGLYDDAVDMLNFVIQNFNTTNIVIHGFSLGGAVVVELVRLAERSGIKVLGLVLDRAMQSVVKGTQAHAGKALGKVAGGIAKRLVADMSMTGALQEIKDVHTRTNLPILLIITEDSFKEDNLKLTQRLKEIGFTNVNSLFVRDCDHVETQKVMSGAELALKLWLDTLRTVDSPSVVDRREPSTALTYEGDESYQLGLVDDFKAFLSSIRSPLRYENIADKDPKVKEKNSIIDTIRGYFSNYEILKDDEAIKEADQVYREEIIAEIGKFKDFGEDKKQQTIRNIVEDFSDDIDILSKLGELYTANLLSPENIKVLLSAGIDVTVDINKILASLKEGKTINDSDLEFLIYKVQTAPIDAPLDTSSSTEDSVAQRDRKEILEGLSDNLEKLTPDQQAKLIEEGILIAYVNPSMSDSVKDVAVKGRKIYKAYKKVEDARDKLGKLKKSGFVPIIFKSEKDGKEVEDNSTFLGEIIENISSRLDTVVNYISELANNAREFVEGKFEGLIEFFEKIATNFGEKFAALLPGWNAVMLLNSARKLWSRTKILKDYILSDKLPKDLQEAFTYSYQKILRAFQTALFRAILHIVKTISRLVTVLSLGSAAIVTESLEKASDIILKIESAGRKLKGVYKLLTGVRGVGRLKNAGVIVHYAIGEGKIDKVTNQVAVDMVKKFVDKLPINLEEEAGFAKEESIKQLIAALSEQLKSQPA